MKDNTLFCSPDAQEIYRVYQILNRDFLKVFKFQAEFRITTISSRKDFCLSVEHVSESERKWLKDATLQILEKKYESVVDKS